MTVFVNSNCTGLNKVFYRDNEKDKDLLMNKNDLQGITFGSVMIPPGYEVVTYEDGEFVVQNDLFAPKDFLTIDGQQECHNLKENLESLQFRKTHTTEAYGQWVQSSYNADIRLSMGTGVNGDLDPQSVVSELEYFMQKFTFKKRALSSEFASEEMLNTLLTAQLGYSNQDVFCKASDEMAALYQWVVKFGEITIMTNHFICRSGPDAWNYPNCPHSACLDEQCQECEEGYWAK